MKPDAHVQRLSYEASLALLRRLGEAPDLQVDSLEPEKHRLVFREHHRWAFRLPLPLPSLPEQGHKLNAYLDTLDELPPSYVLLLVQAGAAALGYVEMGELLEHKAIKKYMKRHKRGKAQITYLNQKGKSKAGSRIRLANTVRFVEEINERLTVWEEQYAPQRILYSCTAPLWGLLFQSNVPPPFEKKDPRLLKIPMNVHLPGYEELQRVHEFVQQGELRWKG